MIESTHILKKNNISVRWMVTLHKRNVDDVPYIIDLALENNVDVLTFERLIPTETGASMKDMILTPIDLSKVYKYIVERSDEEYSKGSSLTILKFRTLWVLRPQKSRDGCIYATSKGGRSGMLNRNGQSLYTSGCHCTSLQKITDSYWEPQERQYF